MQKRAVRFTIVALLLAAGLAAGFIVWSNEGTLRELEADRRNRELAVERLAPLLGSVAAAQQAYVDHGSGDEMSLGRVGALIERITADAAGLRSSARSSESAAHLEELWVALSGLRASAAQARERLAAGESLAAADLLLSTARPHVATVETRLRAFREAELGAFSLARARLMQRTWAALASAAVLWLLGLLALARLPRPAAAPSLTHTPPDATNQVRENLGDTVAERPATAAARPDDGGLSETAAVCASISRLTDSQKLPAILERAARIIDARGLIVWMGAGDELFAVTAWGYAESVVARLPPIKRRADNATAAAWRRGELRIVPGDEAGLGAIVAPMFDASGCVGVVAAEVRNGREADPAAHAVTGIVAAQLALVLSAWPASSATSDAGTQSGSHRQAAAS